MKRVEAPIKIFLFIAMCCLILGRDAAAICAMMLACIMIMVEFK